MKQNVIVVEPRVQLIHTQRLVCACFSSEYQKKRMASLALKSQPSAFRSKSHDSFFFRNRAWARFQLRGRKKVATKETGHRWYRP